MKMKKIIITLASVALLSGVYAQQDPQYSLYQFNMMILNPAYAGARDGFSAVGLNRQQWLGMPGRPQTTCLSVHTPVMKEKLGVGITILNDMIGPRNVIGAYGNVAYILKLSNQFKLHFGVNAGYNRYQFNFNKIEFKASETPPEFSQLNSGNLDINGGIFLRSTGFFVGLSASHINNPKVYTYDQTINGNTTFTYRLKTHIFFTIGNSFVINKNLIFAPTLLVKQVGGLMDVDINANFFINKKLWLGAYYRLNYGVGALMQYYITNRVRAGLTYDTGFGDAMRLGPSFEAMIGVDVPSSPSTKGKMINPRFL
jgi:type IX secretion system PorP/SprF family membrane protein